MNRFLTFLSVLFLCSSVAAQPPGYLGKRAFLSFNTSSFAALNSATQNGRSDWTFGNIGINYEFNLDLSYAVSRYESVDFLIGQ